jgi:hypothetical protein
MLKWFLHRALAKFEKRWGYDASYNHYVIDQSPKSAAAFAFLQGWVDRKAAPPLATLTATLTSTLVEDCGPCTQLGLDMGAAYGVPPEVLRAIIAGDEAGMGPDAALAWRFARASLGRDLLAADEARDEVARRWGEPAVVALSMAVTAGRVYPTLKYALGYGKACSRLTVAGEPARFAKPEPMAA